MKTIMKRKMYGHEISGWRNHGYNQATEITEHYRETEKEKHSAKVFRVHEIAYSRGWHDAIEHAIKMGFVKV